MFERPTSTGDLHADDVAQNVRELCKLDPVYASTFRFDLVHS